MRNQHQVRGAYQRRNGCELQSCVGWEAHDADWWNCSRPWESVTLSHTWAIIHPTIPSPKGSSAFSEIRGFQSRRTADALCMHATIYSSMYPILMFLGHSTSQRSYPAPCKERAWFVSGGALRELTGGNSFTLQSIDLSDAVEFF